MFILLVSHACPFYLSRMYVHSTIIVLNALSYRIFAFILSMHNILVKVSLKSRNIHLFHLALYRRYLGIARQQGSQCGSTAIVALVHGTPPDDVRVTVANVGDSRAILCRDGRAVAMSDDHKPDRPDEARRVAGCCDHII